MDQNLIWAQLIPELFYVESFFLLISLDSELQI